MDSFLRAEISASAVRTNLQLLRGCLRPGTRLCPVVKADAYGHGLELLLETIAAEADMLGVGAGVEAIGLRDLGYAGEVLMLFSAAAYAAASPAPLEELIARDVTLTVTGEADLSAASAAASRVGKDARAHVMIDTGMGRSGIPAATAPQLIRQVRNDPNVRLTGLYTHFAVADVPDKSFTLRQLARFHEAIAAGGGGEGLTLHAANSAATIDLPESHLDMARPGLSVYGYQPYPEVVNRMPLRPALRLVAPLMQVKDVQPGDRVGYGLTWEFARPGRIGLVPVGYADGYLRCQSNRAVMGVRGCDAPVRGRVSMDQTIIDLTEVPTARVGDEVEIISPAPAAPNSVENLARLADTIPQEITTRLGCRVRRVGVC